MPAEETHAQRESTSHTDNPRLNARAISGLVLAVVGAITMVAGLVSSPVAADPSEENLCPPGTYEGAPVAYFDPPAAEFTIPPYPITYLVAFTGSDHIVLGNGSIMSGHFDIVAAIGTTAVHMHFCKGVANTTTTAQPTTTTIADTTTTIADTTTTVPGTTTTVPGTTTTIPDTTTTIPDTTTTVPGTTTTIPDTTTTTTVSDSTTTTTLDVGATTTSPSTSIAAVTTTTLEQLPPPTTTTVATDTVTTTTTAVGQQGPTTVAATLPATGSDSTNYVATLGALLVMLGGGLLIGSRRAAF